MCGRFTQYEPRSHYIEVLAPDKEFAGVVDDIPIDRYNVAPSSRVLLLNQRDDQIYLAPFTGDTSQSGRRNQSGHQ
ncbi:hypothetical protein Q7S_08920 [Rahnella aquatilis HX2]|nr:hypothetical protein Q7S_08920 [Rahnella aquatilis HX2]